jgi:hypothetical protein
MRSGVIVEAHNWRRQNLVAVVRPEATISPDNIALALTLLLSDLAAALTVSSPSVFGRRPARPTAP